MQPHEILAMRLANQRLLEPHRGSPCELVQHLGAVQSQDYPAALWALGLRLPGRSREDVERAYDAGSFVRTHVLRPTWHFVAPHDLRWMLELTGPRIKRSMGARDRELGLNEDLVERTEVALADALSGGKSLTRPEMRQALEDRGLVVADGSVLSHLMLRAELDRLVCSGPMRGKQYSWGLLDERVPPSRPLDREAAVAELVDRYFTSHGPALLTDFAWWSGLTITDARRGLDAHGSRFRCVTVDERCYWYAPSRVEAGPGARPVAHLLPNFDEFTVAYRERGLFASRRPDWSLAPRDEVPFGNVIVIDGMICGLWKRSVVKDKLSIAARWFEAPNTKESRAFGEAAERFAAFHGLPLAA
jgi:hypothetical protein